MRQSISPALLLARLMGQYMVLLAGVCRLSASSVVVCYAAGGVRRAHGRSGGRHCTAGQYGYIPLGRHLVYISINSISPLHFA